MVSQNILIIGAIALIGLLLGGFLLFGSKGDNGSGLIDESDLIGAGKKFLKVNYSEMISMWIGKSEKNISEEEEEFNHILLFNIFENILIHIKNKIPS